VEHTTLQGVVALLERARFYFERFDSFSIYGRRALKISNLDSGKISNYIRFHEWGVLTDEVGITDKDDETRIIRVN
jgi:hypothetical protein